MKIFFSIVFSFLITIPSFGLHLDIDYCCGDIVSISVQHDASNATDCCMARKGKKSCKTTQEIHIAPQALEFTIDNASVLVKVPHSILLLSNFVYPIAIAPLCPSQNNIHLVEKIPWRLSPPSLMCFLC